MILKNPVETEQNQFYRGFAGVIFLMGRRKPFFLFFFEGVSPLWRLSLTKTLCYD
jgi:hypothetical protein